jgi:hypothetical protein
MKQRYIIINSKKYKIKSNLNDKKLFKFVINIKVKIKNNKINYLFYYITQKTNSKKKEIIFKKSKKDEKLLVDYIAEFQIL